MEYTTSAESEALVESAQRLVRERYDYAAQRARAFDLPGIDRVRWREFADLGWLGTSISETSGGLGLPYAVLAALATALGPAAMREPFFSQIACGGHVLDRAAPGTLRDAVLAQWLAGETLLALALEDQSHPVRYEPTAEGFRLHGAKHTVVDGACADYLIVSAQPADAAPRALFLVPAAAAGIERRAQLACDGRVLADLRLEAVTVSSAARLECDVEQVLHEAAVLYALLLAAESLGIMQALVPMTTAYLAERRQFGRPLLEFQVLQHRLADMHIACVRAESAHLLARFKCDEHGLTAARAEVALAKALVGQCGRAVGQQAVQLHGGIGMTEDLVVGHHLKRLVANELLGGSTQVQLEEAARLRGVVPSPL